MANKATYKFARMSLLRIFIVTLILGISSVSCSALRKTEAEQADLRMQKEQKEAAVEAEKLREAHYKRQPKETRKMMKRSKKMSNKLNKKRRLPD